MITYIEGEIMGVGYLVKQQYVEVLTVSGLGYKLFVSSGSTFTVGEKIKMFVSFQVREDSHTLFGFFSREQKDMFENILNVSGIGPKVALSIVSTFSSQEFKVLLMSADYNSLSTVQGLGQKGAKKLVLELQGIYVQDDDNILNEEVFKDLKGALKTLGFKGKELDVLLEKGRKEYKLKDNNMSIESLMSYILKND